jgi:hypothetical protein
VNSTKAKKQNIFQQERRNEDLNEKSKNNYDYNNNKKNFVSLEVANTRNNYNFNQKHVKIEMQENKQNQEVPKKSYFLNRRKQQQKDNEENHNKSLKTLIPHSKSELTNLNYLNNENNHAYDDENNLINLTKSLSFSNSKYKKNDSRIQSNFFDTDDDNDYKKRDNQDFIKYQSGKFF